MDLKDWDGPNAFVSDQRLHWAKWKGSEVREERKAKLGREGTPGSM